MKITQNFSSFLSLSVVAFAPSQSCAFQVHPGRGVVQPKTRTCTKLLATSSDTDGHRRTLISSFPTTIATLLVAPQLGLAAEDVISSDPVIVSPTGEIKKLFNEGRALEQQGNIQASQRIFAKVTKLAPKVCVFFFCISICGMCNSLNIYSKKK